MSKKNNNVIEDISSLSQLGGDAVLRDSHSFPGHYVRTRESLTVVKDFYDSFEINYDVNNLPIQVSYYVGTAAHVTTLACKDDVAGSLNDTYFFLYASQSNARFYIWYNVDGTGTDPLIANSTGIEVPISVGDPKGIVANATQLILNMSTYSPYFNITRSSSILTIANLNNGPISDTVDVSTGFIINNEEGAKELVQKVDLTYNGANPIFNGQELKGYVYNAYTSRFELTSKTVISDSDGNELDINTDGSVNAVIKKDFDQFEADYNANDTISEVRYYFEATLIRTVNLTYDSNDNITGYVES